MMTKISSRMTPLYKFGVPSVILVFNLSLIGASIWLFPPEHYMLYVSFIPLSVLISLIVALPLSVLRHISFNQKTLEIDDYSEKELVPLEKVLSLKRVAFYFYLIRISGNDKVRRIIFMPHISEIMLGGVPIGVQQLRNLLKGPGQ